tara:strand:+ start:203 stop:496 length:294 start_codon:yes stop_codon:yes gene_type:complete
MIYINKIIGVFKMNKWNLDLNDWTIREKKNNRDVIQIEEMRTSFKKFSMIVNANEMFDLFVDLYNKLPIKENELRLKAWEMIERVETGTFEEIPLKK